MQIGIDLGATKTEYVLLDDNNKDLITDEMKAAVEKAKADIIAGDIKVHDYIAEGECPF